MDQLLELDPAEWLVICDLLGHDRERFLLRCMMARGEATVYDLVDDSRTKYSGIFAVQIGLVYTRLVLMEGARIVERVRAERSGAPGRRKHRYRVTDFGRAVIKKYDAATAWIREPIPVTSTP